MKRIDMSDYDIIKDYINEKHKNDGFKTLLNIAALYFITKEIKKLKSTIKELKLKGE